MAEPLAPSPRPSPARGEDQEKPLLSRQQTERLARRLRLAQGVLLWEAFWPLAWPASAVLALFAALALMDVLPRLPPWPHVFVLLGFAIALGILLARLRHLRKPSPAHAERRLEHANSLPHRPLTLLADRIATPADDPIATALWLAARQKTARGLGKIAHVLPLPNLALHDPWGLRFVPLILLFIGLAAGWQDAPTRFWRALVPVGLAGPPPTMEIWVTPPRYTGLPPVLLSGVPSDKTLSVPTGSRLTAALQGGMGHAQLVIGEQRLDFQILGEQSQRLETTLTQGTQLTVRQGFRSVGRWSVQINPDLPPTVLFAAPPGVDADKRLQLPVQAADDFGVVKLSLEVRRAADPVDTPPLQVPLPLAGRPKEIQQTIALDLSSHPWAGQAVTLALVAEDGAGQQGRSATESLRLPERAFTHPVARAVIGWRRVLLDDASQRAPVIAGLNTITAAPKAFGDDLIAFLALSDATARLTDDPTADGVSSVTDLLWQAALRIEEGTQGSDRAAFDAAAQALSDALTNGASPEQLDALMARFRQALGRLLSSIGKTPGATTMKNGPARILSGKDLQSMMAMLDDLAHTGSGQAAKSMVDRLKALVDNLSGSTAGQPVPGEGESGADGNGTDPFGRPVGGYGGADGVKIPNQGDIGKAREILDELRRRTDDYARPAPERDYLNRLLEKLY